jgi:hypothetical protein
MRFILSFLLLLNLHGILFAQQDSVLTKQQDSFKVVRQKVLFSPSPKGAVIRGAIVPGWGQVYTRKYWKLPLVYTALGTAGYFIGVNYWSYQQTRLGISRRLDADPSNDYNPLLVRDFNYRQYDISDRANEDLFKVKAYFRHNLDLSVIGFAAVYMLTLVDANVSAHLYNFNMSEDLSLSPRVSPTSIGFALQFK